MNFDEAYKRLNEISAEMEENDIPLEKALALYSEATKLVSECKKDIEKAKIEIQNINEMK